LSEKPGFFASDRETKGRSGKKYALLWSNFANCEDCVLQLAQWSKPLQRQGKQMMVVNTSFVNQVAYAHYQ
jgi:hypothetical protein